MVVGLVLFSKPGYSETFFRNKIRFLTEAGIKVIVFANNADGKNADYSIVEGFCWGNNRIKRAEKAILAIMRLMRSPNKTLTLYRLNKVDGYSAKKNFLSLLASAHILKFKLNWLHFGFATVALGRENLAKTLGARMAISIRGFDIAIYPQDNPDCYRLLWRRLDKLHCISDDLLSLAAEQGFENKIPYRKITPAIDTSLFEKRKRSSFGSPLKIMTVARLHWIKGLEYTLEALSRLNSEGIDFEYTVIGDGEDYERLVFASYQLGIKEKVRFVGKKTPREVKQFLQESDIYLQYSIHEGFCNAVLEAQAMGLLCIVSDGGALPENVLHERTGWIVPKRDAAALADRIIKVINLSEAERTRISRAATKRISGQFNLEKQKREFLEFYR